MSYIFNKDKIQRLLWDFYVSTDVAITFYDAEMNVIATSPVLHDFCKHIREQKERTTHCTHSNLTHMKEAAKKKTVIFYTCHAGLMETIMPIFYEDTLIAFLQIGQFKDKDGKYSSVQKVLDALNEYGIPQESILPLYENVPTVSNAKLQSLQSIMDIVVKAFWEDGLIYSNRSMLSVKIEQYIAEHLHEKIYVENLCNRFFLSKNAMYRLFNTEFQMTVNEYVLQKRLHLSQKLLKETNQAITKIASDCGFSDYNYFIRLFKQRIGVTPLQFRKSSV